MTGKKREEATFKQVGGAEIQERMVSHPHVAIENGEGYLGCRYPLRGKRGLGPIQAPLCWVLILGREISITSGYENQWRLWLSETEGYMGPKHSS